MNTSIEIYQNEEFGSVRTLILNDAPWFVGRDVATALGYADPKDALKKHVDAEDKQVIQRGQFATFNIPTRGLTIINESGLYALIFGSKLPAAKRFKRWVTSEVLPAIRKTGTYSTEKALPTVPVLPKEEQQPDAEMVKCLDQSLMRSMELARQRRIGYCSGVLEAILEQERGDTGSLLAIYGLLSEQGKRKALDLMFGEVRHEQ